MIHFSDTDPDVLSRLEEKKQLEKLVQEFEALPSDFLEQSYITLYGSSPLLQRVMEKLLIMRPPLPKRAYELVLEQRYQTSEELQANP